MGKQPTQKSVVLSLAARIFFINVLILVLPLLVHSVFSYREEYKLQVKDAFTSLRIIASNRARLLQDLFKAQENMLRLVEQVVVNKKKDTNRVSLKKYFQEATSLSDAWNLFYLKIGPKGTLECAASARPCSPLLPQLQKFIGDKRFLYVRGFQGEARALFYVGKTVFDPKTGSPLGLLIVADSAEKLVQGFAHLDQSSSLSLSFVDGENEILASSEPQLRGQQVVEGEHASSNFSLVPMAGIEKGFLFRGNNLAVKFSVPGLPGYLLLDILESHVKSLHIDIYLYRLGLLLFFIVIVGGAICIGCTLRMARPLRELFSVMDLVRSGETNARYRQDRLGFEINTLGSHFNSMIRAVLDEQKKSAKERAQKEIYAQELLFGHEIQESLLRFDKSGIPIDVESYYASSKEVGGDFYDLFFKDQDTLYFSLADVSGKGVSACLYALGLRSSLRTSVPIASLEQALFRANHLFYLDALDTGMFASIWAAYYQIKTGELTYVNAGHWPSLLRRKTGEILSLDTKAPSLGIEDNSTFSPETITLFPGDVLVLYSDGILEMRNARGEFYGKERLQRSLKNTADFSAAEILDSISADYDAFRGALKPEDDVTVLVLRF